MPNEPTTPLNETIVTPKEDSVGPLNETLVRPGIPAEERISAASDVFKGTIQQLIAPETNTENPQEESDTPSQGTIISPRPDAPAFTEGGTIVRTQEDSPVASVENGTVIRAPVESPAPVLEGRQTVQRAIPESQTEDKGTIVRTEERSASRDVVSIEAARIPKELVDSLNEAHEAFQTWRSAGMDQRKIDAAKDAFSTSIQKIEKWLEALSLEATLEPEERLDLVSFILFGKTAEEVIEEDRAKNSKNGKKGENTKILEMFEEVQSLENPEGQYGDGLAALLERVKNLGFCITNDKNDLIAITLLQIDLWGSRNAKQLMADFAAEKGYKTVAVDTLGEGAMGRVFRLLKDPSMGEDEELVVKFSTIGQDLTYEGKVTAKASAAGAGPRTKESSRPDRAIFMVYQKGAKDLDGAIKSKAIPFNPALMAQIMRQTGKLHKAGIIHRDLKPGNVILTENGTKAVIIDYGVALDAAEEDPYGTKLVGTPQYFSPEATLGQYGEASDIYALGCLAFEWATGKKWLDHVRETSQDGKDDRGFLEVAARIQSVQKDETLFQKALDAIPRNQPKLREAIEKSLNPNLLKRAKSTEEAAGLFEESMPEFTAGPLNKYVIKPIGKVLNAIFGRLRRLTSK